MLFLQPELSERGTEKVEMRKIVEQQPSKEALRVADVLSGLGFELKLLGSQKHASDKLHSLSPEQLEALKESFVKDASAFQEGDRG